MKKTPYLKIKLKSLAAEAKIIRAEEKKTKDRGNIALMNGLRCHRVTVVRQESRVTLLAYNFLRGRTYVQTESGSNILAISAYQQKVLWDRVRKMVRSYGEGTSVQGDSLEEWIKTAGLVPAISAA